jgi:NTE family protein
MTERLFATDYFERVTYTYVPAEQHPGRVRLIFTLAEKPFTRIEASLHFSTFTGVGIIGGIMSNKFLLYNLNAKAKARIGEQPAIQAGLDFFTNERQKTWISLQVSGDAISFPVYERFEPRASYRQRYARAETTINRLTGPNAYITTGIAAYRQRLKPTMLTDFMVSGKNRGYEAFAALNVYTLNRHDLPQRGQNLLLKASFFMNQNPEIEIETDGQTTNDLSSIGIRIRNFLQIKLNWESYVPVHQGLSFYTRLQGGFNFNYFQDFINMFNLGGTLPFLRDQVTFAGLNEYEVMTASVISVASG